ncbi:MAG: DUF29 domain-containing protein [Microcystaceae cyanobacterium]
MVAELQPQLKSLYDTDYHLWVTETVKQLQNRELDSLDWENLIEEVSDLSRRNQKKLKSLLKLLFEHLLKLKYWQAEIDRNQNHWKREIRNFRQQIKDELEDSPSLTRYFVNIIPDCYQSARKLISDETGLNPNAFPEAAIASLEQILDEDWLP